MAVNDVYKLTCRASYVSNMVIQNTFYLKRIVAGEPSTSDVQTLADDFKEALRATTPDDLVWRDYLCNQVAGAGVVWSQPSCLPSGGKQFGAGFSASTAGTLTGDPLPPQAALVITLLTGNVGRRRRGRLYLISGDEGAQNAGIYTGGHLGTVGTTWAAQVVQYGSAGTDPSWRWVVFSTRIASGCAPDPNNPKVTIFPDLPNPSDAHREITGLTARSVVYNQRRRTVGVGR